MIKIIIKSRCSLVVVVQPEMKVTCRAHKSAKMNFASFKSVFGKAYETASTVSKDLQSQVSLKSTIIIYQWLLIARI